MDRKPQIPALLAPFLAILMALIFSIRASAFPLTEADFFAAGKLFESAMSAELEQNAITVQMEFQRKNLQAYYEEKVIYLGTDGATPEQKFNSVLTSDAYVLILCHELGHGIGGLAISQSAKTSVEGQADYYAVNSCFKKIFSNAKDNEAFVKMNTIDADLLMWCKRHVTDTDAYNWCLRAGMASLSLTKSNELATAHLNSPTPKITTPDCSQNVLKFSFARSIKSQHPSNQCRLDTYMRALINEPPPPCWFGTENEKNIFFFERMDQLYASKNICQTVCQNLPSTTSDKEREQRCLSAPCTRMLFPLIEKHQNYAVVDNDYHLNINKQVEHIIAAESKMRKDCSVQDSKMITLEMLLNNTTESQSLCDDGKTSSTHWQGPYSADPILKTIIMSGKNWCVAPKLNNDCVDSKFFERTLKNCLK